MECSKSSCMEKSLNGQSVVRWVGLVSGGTGCFSTVAFIDRTEQNRDFWKDCFSKIKLKQYTAVEMFSVMGN